MTLIPGSIAFTDVNIDGTDNPETFDVQSGMPTLQSAAADQVDVATGEMVTSQVELTDQGQMTVALGGSVLVTSGLVLAMT